MINKPELLIVADEILAYGINQKYYPSMDNALAIGKIAIVPLESDLDKYNLTQSPTGDGSDVYVLNPYANNYALLWDPQILDTFITDKSFAIKEALGKMGAKRVTIKKDIKDEDSTKIKLKDSVEAKMSLAKGNVNAEFDRKQSVNIESIIEYHDPNRKARPTEEIRQFLKDHGLMSEGKLTLLLERLETEGEIHGSEKYTTTFCSELANAFKLGSTVDCKLFNNNLDLSVTSNHVHAVSETLEIEFD